MKTIYDNVNEIARADDRVVLVEDDDGILRETTNAATNEIVNSSMFVGWGIEQEPKATEWKKQLAKQFGSKKIANRYYAAATDQDK